MAKKNNFQIITEEEDFNKCFQQQVEDDAELVSFLSTLVEQEKHREFNFAILNIGTLMQTISVFFYLKEKEINDILQLKSDSVKQRKITVIVNELNEKINLKYGFDENAEVITKIFVYEENSYLNINKKLFVQLLFGTGFLDVSNMDNI